MPGGCDRRTTRSGGMHRRSDAAAVFTTGREAGPAARRGRRGRDMSTLKRIYVAANAMDAHMLRDLLAQEAIEAVVRGDDVVPLQGGSLFMMETRPSVWVLDDDRLPRARALAAEFGSGPPPADRRSASWRCRCGETLEAQFSDCWRCGRARPEPD